jgi:hypothetical protein
MALSHYGGVRGEIYEANSVRPILCCGLAVGRNDSLPFDKKIDVDLICDLIGFIVLFPRAVAPPIEGECVCVLTPPDQTSQGPPHSECGTATRLRIARGAFE